MDTSPGFLSTAGMFPGLDVWVAIDAVVEIVYVLVGVVVEVEVVSQSQRASSLLSVCTAEEEEEHGASLHDGACC